MLRTVVFIFILLVLVISRVEAQPGGCDASGVALGYGSICVHPWSPPENQDFELNFSSTSCTQQTNHDYRVIKEGNNFNIYMVYGVGGCPGVPQGPLSFFTTQEGTPAGSYTANLYRLTVPSWPPPAFDENDYILFNSVDFTVLGQPGEVEPVPTIGITAFFINVALVLAIGVALLHRYSIL
jgi:hypothetical protein